MVALAPHPVRNPGLHRGPGGRAVPPHGIPALDGVRALAVLAVLADHGGVAGLPGGFVGVDVFFVLSGFLITSLLLQEHRRTGRIRLGAFWARRARRLLPALVLMVLAVITLRRAFAPDSVSGLRLDALAALGWVANWRFAARHTDYFAQGGMASPLQHTWSLGVEEQYYLLWPLILVTVVLLSRHRRYASPAAVRRTVGWLAVVGAAASAGAALRLSGSGSLGRVYFGSDTRAQALLIGAAAAALIGGPSPPGFADRRRARRSDRRPLATGRAGAEFRPGRPDSSDGGTDRRTARIVA